MSNAIEEIDHLRRLVSSLNPSVLDDDFVAPEMDWAEAPVAKTTGDRDLQHWFADLEPGDDDNDDE